MVPIVYQHIISTLILLLVKCIHSTMVLMRDLGWVNVTKLAYDRYFQIKSVCETSKLHGVRMDMIFCLVVSCWC
jgi:hypothetical protein